MDDAATLPEHVAKNREYWDQQAADYVASGERSWARDEPKWGIFGIPESEARLLPERLDGLVNNAGIVVGGPVEAVPVDEWRRQLEVNVVGQVAVTIRGASWRSTITEFFGSLGSSSPEPVPTILS